MHPLMGVVTIGYIHWSPITSIWGKNGVHVTCLAPPQHKRGRDKSRVRDPRLRAVLLPTRQLWWGAARDEHESRDPGGRGILVNKRELAPRFRDTRKLPCATRDSRDAIGQGQPEKMQFLDLC